MERRKKDNKKQGSIKKSKVDRMPIGKCFNCDKKGHWNKDELYLLAKK